MLKTCNFKSLTRKPSYSSFFSVLCPDLKNVFFGKIHWAPSEILVVAEAIFEVAEAKFWISSIFNGFSFRIFVILSFEVVCPQRPRRPQKGLRQFFQKLHFWNQGVPKKKMRYITASWLKFLLNLSTEEMCNLPKKKKLALYSCLLVLMPTYLSNVVNDDQMLSYFITAVLFFNSESIN